MEIPRSSSHHIISPLSLSPISPPHPHPKRQHRQPNQHSDCSSHDRPGADIAFSTLIPLLSFGSPFSLVVISPTLIFLPILPKTRRRGPPPQADGLARSGGAEGVCGRGGPVPVVACEDGGCGGGHGWEEMGEGVGCCGGHYWSCREMYRGVLQEKRSFQTVEVFVYERYFFLGSKSELCRILMQKRML